MLNPSWQLCHTKEKTRRDERPSRVSPAFICFNFPSAPLLMSDLHTFLSSQLIIFIIKIIFINPAHREGKRRVTAGAQGEEELNHHRAPSKASIAFSCLHKEPGSTSTHLHWHFRQSRMAKWERVTPFQRGPLLCWVQGWSGLGCCHFPAAATFLLLPSLTAPSPAPFQAAGLEACFCLSSA